VALNKCRNFLLAALACAPAGAQPDDAAAGGFDLQRPEIIEFVNDVVSRDGLNRKDVRALLKEAQPQPKILETMNRPIEKVAPWWEYRDRFLTRDRISDGVRFWLDHKNSLEQVCAQYQVPCEYLVAILGVETHYGRNTGPYRALDALATLAFDYPPRQKFFRGELEEFLLLAKENKLDPLNVPGSYAGALGVPQFMPSQYRRYAVAASSDRPRDLCEHGWVAGGPVLAETRLEPDPSFQIEPHNLELNETVESLAAHGVKVEMSVPADTPVVLISAEQRDGPAYRVGFHNFYVLTRYNASARYVMAVHELAQAVAQRMHDAAP